MPFIPEEQYLKRQTTETGITSEELKTPGIFGKIGSFLGMEKLGRRVGYGLTSFMPGQKQLLSRLQESEQQGFAPEGTVSQLKTGGVSGREALASAGQTALNILPITGIGSKFLQAGGKLVPQMARSAGLGATFGTTQALQEKETTPGQVLTSVLTGATIGAALPVAGRLISKTIEGLKKVPEKLYNQIFKQAEQDLAKYYKTGALVDLQKSNPTEFNRLLGKGIIRTTESGIIEINPTLAREALDKGLQGSSENMAKYSYLKQLELEDKVRQIATKENLIQNLDNKKGYIDLLKSLTKEFKDKNYGFFPDRLQTANDLITRFKSVKGNQIDAETALMARRYFDGLRATKSFTDPFSPLSQKQELLKESANSMRAVLSKIPGIKGLMNDYRIFIDAFDAIVEDAVKRQNAKILTLTDILIGGGGLASGYPGPGLGAMAAVRGFQQPTTLTTAARGLDKLMKLGSKIRPSLGNVPGGLSQTGILQSRQQSE